MSAMEEEVVDDGASGVSRCARRISLGLSHPLSTPHHHGARDESDPPCECHTHSLAHSLTNALNDRANGIHTRFSH
jgi:hypothetical protein